MRRIAIVDDSELDIQHLKEILSRYLSEKNINASIDLYRNPLMFLERYSKNFDLIFFDIEMPGISGILTGKKLKDENPNIIIFIVNAKTNNII